MSTPLFRRDFTMVVIGQIISLFGNSVLQYALPLYLLNQTHSPSLFGLVSACAFLPMILLAPVGGLVADRVNKRNIMAALDFSTAGLVAFYLFFYSRLNLVALLLLVLMLLYGIQGAYQPAVQASIPALVAQEKLTAGNAVVNMVNSLAGIIGPALGGVLYGLWGLRPVLLVSIVCFFASAVMELFLHIPFVRRPKSGSVFSVARADIRESLHFIRRDCPVVGKTALLLAGINLVFSSLIIIALPVIISEFLGFSPATGNRLYGYAQAALAAGGLAGGLLSGLLNQKLALRHCPLLFLLCTATLLPMGTALLIGLRGMPAYWILTLSCFAMMILSTLISIQFLTYIQRITPATLIGKVMALLSCVAMCAHPLGQALYGLLFQRFAAQSGWIFLLAFAVCLWLCAASKRLCAGLRMPPQPSAG